MLAAGDRVGWRDGRLAPGRDDDGQTSVPGLFVAGDAAGGSADAAAWLPGAACRVGGGRDVRSAPGDGDGGRRAGLGDPPRSTTVGRPPAAGSAGAVLCFCEDVRVWEVRARSRPPDTPSRSSSSAGPARSPVRARASTACRPSPALAPVGGADRARA